MKIKCYGGPKDGAWSPDYGPELRIPKPIDFSSNFIVGEGMVPMATVSLRFDVYRLISDPVRGPAYIYDKDASFQKSPSDMGQG